MIATSTEHPGAPAVEWFATWFDSPHYHQLYSYRNDAEAAAFIDELMRRLKPAAGAKAIDLGCGAGRHAMHLAARGFDVTGLDLSSESIRRAKQWEMPGLRFVRQDMREPFGRQSFDYVFSFFTSFGYFDDIADNVGVIRNIAGALRPHGRVVLDYLNVHAAEARMRPFERRRVGEFVYDLSRWSDARHFFKRIDIETVAADHVATHVERVARFSLEDFREMFAAAGMQIVNVYGDYRLNPYDPYASPRMIVVANKKTAAELKLGATYDSWREARSSTRKILANAADRFR